LAGAEAAQAVGAVGAIAPPPKSNLVLLPQSQPEPEEELSDYELARWALRGVISCPTQQGASIIVQAAQALMKLLVLKAKLPKHILEDSLDPAEEIKNIREEFKNMSAAEIADEYFKMIGRT
jgi:hypothetical protein